MADDEFDTSEAEFDARWQAAEPARIVPRDERASLSPLRFEAASKAMPDGGSSVTPAARFESNNVRRPDRSADTALRTADLATSLQVT